MTNESPITVTPIAAEKLEELMKEEEKNSKTTSLRVFVQGGGCSGFQYGLTLEEDANKTDNDQVFESHGIKLMIDPISIRYLQGAVIDFGESPSGGGFQFKNPNAKSTCGCGSSFNTK